MNDTTFESSDKLEKSMLHATLKMCIEAGKVHNVKFSEEFVHTLGRLAFRQTGLFAEDLEFFAKHAKRSTINADDIRLLLRKKSSVIEHVNKFFSSNKEKTKTTKKKRNSDEADLNLDSVAGPSKIQKPRKKRKEN